MNRPRFVAEFEFMSLIDRLGMSAVPTSIELEAIVE